MRILDKVRIFNNHLLNPVMMLMAGRKHWYAGVIEHTGRRTGKRYATPVVIEEVADGFIIPLPYGTHVDWLRNVLAAERATIRVHGRTHDVAEPHVIDASTAARQLSPRRRREFAGFGVENYLKISQQPSPATPPA